MTRRGKALGYAIILLWTFGPIILSGIGYGIAAAFGCELNEGDVHPCKVFGRDIGGALYTLGMMGWFGILTFPTGIPALIGFIISSRKT